MVTLQLVSGRIKAQVGPAGVTREAVFSSHWAIGALIHGCHLSSRRWRKHDGEQLRQFRYILSAHPTVLALSPDHAVAGHAVVGDLAAHRSLGKWSSDVARNGNMPNMFNWRRRWRGGVGDAPQGPACICVAIAMPIPMPRPAPMPPPPFGLDAAAVIASNVEYCMKLPRSPAIPIDVRLSKAASTAGGKLMFSI